MKTFDNDQLGVRLTLEDDGQYEVSSTCVRQESMMSDYRVWRWVYDIMAAQQPTDYSI